VVAGEARQATAAPLAVEHACDLVRGVGIVEAVERLDDSAVASVPHPTGKVRLDDTHPAGESSRVS